MEVSLISVGVDWVKLRVHPNEINEFLLDKKGDRYMLAAIHINNDETPENPAHNGDIPTKESTTSIYIEGKRTIRTAAAMETGVSMAGVLSRSAAFMQFCGEKPPDEYIRNWCSVKTRADIDKTPGSIGLLNYLLIRFGRWLEAMK